MPTMTASIVMSPATTMSLKASGYTLDVFRVVKANDASTMPAVWISAEEYGTTTHVAWSEQVMAYSSSTAIAVSNTIAMGFTSAIAPGQVLKIDNKAGTGLVTGDGIGTAISVQNTSGQSFTAGVCASARVQSNERRAAPFCAAILYGQDLKLIELTSKVLFVFSGSVATPGTIVERSQGPGAIVDFAGAPGGARSLRYDVDSGWSWDNAAWADRIPPGAELKPLLAVRSSRLVKMRKANRKRLLD